MDYLKNKAMKYLFYILFFVSAFSVAQGKYLTKTGVLSFEASVPSFEEVEAKNNSVTAIINTENGEIAALALIKGFRFKNALMEEHFNENYAESNKYPKANFKGKIANFSPENATGNFKINGELSFHGVTKAIENIPATVNNNNGKIIIEGTFKVLVSDFKIAIPKIVKNKISDDVSIHFKFELQKQ
jgi:polyisoprenoid-binding protein YceI